MSVDLSVKQLHLTCVWMFLTFPAMYCLSPKFVMNAYWLNTNWDWFWVTKMDKVDMLEPLIQFGFFFTIGLSPIYICISGCYTSHYSTKLHLLLDQPCLVTVHILQTPYHLFITPSFCYKVVVSLLCEVAGFAIPWSFDHENLSMSMWTNT